MFNWFDNIINWYILIVFQGTIDQFDYPRKGKNIPPPRDMMGYVQQEGEMGDGQEYGDGPQM